MPDSAAHVGSPLKTLRYEDAIDGVAPTPVQSINLPAPPALSNSLPSPRPRTSPGPRASSRTPTHEAKRDSGIAPSISTAGRDSFTESNLAAPGLGAAKEPNLPTIVVQDDETPLERSRSPFARLRAKDKEHVRPRTASPASGSSGGIQRIQSFKGIQSEIPTGDFEDIDLEDLASDRVGFSHRGSLMFGGRKMNELLQSSGSQRSANGVTSNTNPYALSIGEPEEDVQPPQKDGPPPGENGAKDEQEPTQGLRSGRRKPSVQMLQAALENGRVLSAEEITFSMKVRSMYEHGDENAAQWTNGANGETPQRNSARSAPTPESSLDAIAVSKTGQDQSRTHPALRAPTPSVHASHAKGENELAGGIEDWDDVDGQDIDRYGFIVQKRRPSRSSNASGGPPPNGVGMQRVATALQFPGERRDRKLRRGPSVLTRASRSVPPRPSNDDTVRGNGSIRTVHSHRSANLPGHSTNPFRSRDRRTLAEAADMLTPPPGLSNIAEADDVGKTASTLKRREWAREEKWQKMARPVKAADGSQSVGGGMHFAFDTADAKLVSRTWKGIPDRWRATAWHSFLSASAKARNIGASDAALEALFPRLQTQSCADDVQIDVDVPRTISLHIMFRRRYRGGQRLLFRVLHAIALYFPETGYVQGMASLAATLLCYYDEARAFVMLVRLWQLRGLEALFQPGFEGLMAALKEFEDDWLGRGEVAAKLEELGIGATAYGTRWYLTLFNMSVPFPAQLRVWDVFMLLGDAPNTPANAGDGGGGAFGGADLSVLHATSAALIDATRAIVLDADFENAMKVLTSFVPVRDEDLLMRVARAEWRMRRKRK